MSRECNDVRPAVTIAAWAWDDTERDTNMCFRVTRLTR